MFEKLMNFLTRNEDIKSHFTRIYEKNIWKGKESRSGEGSTYEQTKEIRQKIPVLMKELRVSVFVDAPCGDLHWIGGLDLGVDRYIGIDIVAAIIDTNRVKYRDTNKEFMCLDISSEPLPTSDLIFSRDCLVLLSYETALSAINNFKKSGARYLLTTTFPSVNENKDIKISEKLS